MEAKDYLAYIVNEIHTTIVATVDCLHCGNCMKVCPAGAVKKR